MYFILKVSPEIQDSTHNDKVNTVLVSQGQSVRPNSAGASVPFKSKTNRRTFGQLVLLYEFPTRN